MPGQEPPKARQPRSGKPSTRPCLCRDPGAPPAGPSHIPPILPHLRSSPLKPCTRATLPTRLPALRTRTLNTSTSAPAHLLCLSAPCLPPAPPTPQLLLPQKSASGQSPHPNTLHPSEGCWEDGLTEHLRPGKHSSGTVPSFSFLFFLSLDLEQSYFSLRVFCLSLLFRNPV